MEKEFLKGNLNKKLVSFVILVSMVIVPLATMSPMLSADPGYRVRVPNVSVNLVETYPGAHSYFDTALSGVGAGYDVYDGTFIGWCCDEHNYIYPGTLYSVRLYSTYNPLMPWPDPDWNKVNYLLNHKAGTPDQIQSAIWYFINGGYSGSDLIILGMINDALAHGVNFIPQEGQICAVLCDIDPTVQHTFIEVKVPPPPCTVSVDKTYTVFTPGYGYDHFKIIQDGVDAVCYTGTVIVHNGIYNEQVTINKPITLQNGSLPIIDGGGSGNGITIAANGVTINGFEIRNCANGIYSYGTHNSIIKNNIIHNNLNAGSGYAGCGIMFWSDVNDFDGNQILNNHIYNNDRQGIYIGGSYDDAIISAGNTISGNTIYNNGLNTLANPPDNSAYGIQLSYADSNTISDNDIYGHIWDTTGSGYWFGQGIYLNNAYDNTVEHNELHSNNYGVAQYTDGGRTLGTNYIDHNNIVGNTEYGIRNYDSVQIDATCNWWGDITGPSGQGTGSGDPVSTNVVYCPWLNAAYPAGDCIDNAAAHCEITSTDYKTGPFYIYPRDGYTVDLCNNCSFVIGCGGELANPAYITYLWNFGDGTTSTLKCPGPHTYVPNCPQEGGCVYYTVTMKVTYNDGTTLVTCSDSALVVAYCADNDPPIVQLTYPTGGETLSGTATVRWFALDSDLLMNLPIYLFYSADNGNHWMPINNDPLFNTIDDSHGEYKWSTTGLSDGQYRFMVEAVDNYNNVASASSNLFTIKNGIAGMMVSDVQIMDTTIDSNHWVKNGDSIQITAGITGGSSLNREDIKADLSGFGKGNSVTANSYDGFIATWTLSKVKCNPSDGPITITVTVGDHSKSNIIQSDNSAPGATIIKPTAGVYFLNSKVFPFSRQPLIIGPITMQIDATDTSGVAKVAFYVDDELQQTVNEKPFSWYMSQRLKGTHTLEFIVYDFAGNTKTLSTVANFLNVFGSG